MFRNSTLIVISLLVFVPLGGWASVLHVPMEYGTIQDGINAAAIGDTVLLDSGIYYGSGNRDIDFLGKDITVRSQDGNPSTCTIYCQGTLENPHRGFVFQSGESSSARLEGVTISGGFISGYGPLNESGGGILCINGSSPIIRNCRITQCEANFSGGGFSSSYSSPTLVDCKIDNNYSGSCGGGMAVGGSDPFVMIGCLVTDNVCAESDGADGLVMATPSFLIYECTIANHQNTAILADKAGTLSYCTLINNGLGVYADSHMTVENTLFAFNETAFYDFGAPTHNISCSDAFGNENGDWVGSVAHHANINGNISADPFLCDPGNWDYHVAPDSPCLNDLCGQIGAFGVAQCQSLSPVSENPEISFKLQGNYPNPFNPSTTIGFITEHESAVRLQIFDISGKLVRTLVDDSSLTPGSHETVWNGRDDNGQNVAAGVFLYVLSTPHGRDTGRMALIK